MNTNSFQLRHIGPRIKDQKQMLETIKANSIDQLIFETIPDDIRLENELDLAPAMSEYEYLNHINELGAKNKVFKSYIGLGYHEAIVPSVIQRNILENPGWYTAYTPYQAEIAQGRLEALLNYQTMVCDLTGMELANASLLDEGTAAAEAMALLFDVRERAQKKAGVNKFFISEEILPQTLSVLQTRAIPIGIDLVIGNHQDFDFSEDFFGAILQYPGKHGQVYDYTEFVAKANENNIKVAVAADILSLVKLKAPAEFGADVVVGTTQRFGIPLGYGGPHAGYFATKEKYKRSIPGRIIGVTKDVDGGRALRMALQTREQHIKREKATSNICTAQVLLAVMAGMYAVYHGKDGIQYIADSVHTTTNTLAKALTDLGFEQTNSSYFDTISVKVEANKLRSVAEANGINFNYIDDNTVSISVNETVGLKEINAIVDCFEQAFNVKDITVTEFASTDVIPENTKRNTSFLDNEVFNTYQSETEMMRYIKKLERKDLALNHSMISLGSCTMKLNAASEMLPLSNPHWGNIHPFVPLNQAEGYQTVLKNLEHQLNVVTGFAGT
ncbi:MAG: glycine dehydrogenase (aminomethyl-transferring), partial [Flavobacteriaceae bacterium]